MAKTIDKKFVGKPTEFKIETYRAKTGGTDKFGNERTVTMGRYQDPKTGSYKCVKNF